MWLYFFLVLDHWMEKSDLARHASRCRVIRPIKMMSPRSGS